MPFPAALFEVDIVATPFVVAVVNDVAMVDGVALAMRPSSTRLMSSGEAGVLTPGLSNQLGCLNIWIWSKCHLLSGQLFSPDPLEAPENWCH